MFLKGYINLTPHRLVVVDWATGNELITLAECSRPAEVAYLGTEPQRSLRPITAVARVRNVPDVTPGKTFIVTPEVALAMLPEHRTDLVFPNTRFAPGVSSIYSPIEGREVAVSVQRVVGFSTLVPAAPRKRRRR